MSEQAGLTVAVVGATGAVGQDLVTALARSSVPVKQWRLLASHTTRTRSIDVDGESIRVHGAPPVFAKSPLFEGVDLVVFACPPRVVAEQAHELAEEGIALLDLSGALAGQAPLVVPAVSAAPLVRFRETRTAVIPSASATLIASVVAPLMGLGVERVRGTVMLSASAAGKAGMEELSQQVVAMFNHGEPPRAVFPSGLAFDLVSEVGERDLPWTTTERRLSAELGELLHREPQDFSLTVCVVPTFSGIAASLDLELAEGVSLDEARAAFADLPTVRLGDPVPGPRRLTGKAAAYVGRLRPDPRGQGLALWCAADNLRFAASSTAVSVASALVRTGML